MVRRLIVAMVAAASLLAVSPVVADAGSTRSVSYTLSGSSQWSPVSGYPTSFAISGDVLEGNRTAGTYSGTLSISGFSPCAEQNNPYGPNCATATGGTVTFDVRGGSFTASVDSGTVWEVCCPGPSFEEYVFELSLSVTGGTRAYASAQGSLSLHYETLRDHYAPDPATSAPCGWVDVTKCPITDQGAVTGTITR
jgi:hypothetical protein